MRTNLGLQRRTFLAGMGVAITTTVLTGRSPASVEPAGSTRLLSAALTSSGGCVALVEDQGRLYLAEFTADISGRLRQVALDSVAVPQEWSPYGLVPGAERGSLLLLGSEQFTWSTDTFERLVVEPTLTPGLIDGTESWPTGPKEVVTVKSPGERPAVLAVAPGTRSISPAELKVPPELAVYRYLAVREASPDLSSMVLLHGVEADSTEGAMVTVVEAGRIVETELERAHAESGTDPGILQLGPSGLRRWKAPRAGVAPVVVPDAKRSLGIEETSPGTFVLVDL